MPWWEVREPVPVVGDGPGRDGVDPRYRRACLCRKPAPGLLERAAGELDLSLEHSWMVGDILDDVEAGHRAGCRAVLVDNGGETEWLRTPVREPDIIVTTFDEAARAILCADRRLLA